MGRACQVKLDRLLTRLRLDIEDAGTDLASVSGRSTAAVQDVSNGGAQVSSGCLPSLDIAHGEHLALRSSGMMV
jgi:hypothetical protein